MSSKKDPKAEHLRHYAKTAYAGDDDEIAGFIAGMANELERRSERITELEAEEKRRQPEKGMLTVDKNRYSELLEAEKMNGYLTATIEKARNLPTYLCEFPDIGKVGPAIRQRDLWAALAEAQKETPAEE